MVGKKLIMVFSINKISYSALLLVSMLLLNNVHGAKYSSCDISTVKWLSINDIDKDGYIEIDYNNCKLNLTGYRYLAIPIKNNSNENLLIDALWGNGKKWLDFNARYILEPNSIDTIKYLIHRRKEDIDNDWLNHFPNARGFPKGVHQHWRTINLEELKYIHLRFSSNKKIDFNNIFFTAPIGNSKYDPLQFKSQEIPILDNMGQYNSSSWDGKVEDVNQLNKEGEIDKKLYLKATFNQTYSKFGGYIKTKKHNATGFFRTQNIDGKWWLIDPEGYKFWSTGITGAGKGNATKILNKEFLFTDLSNDKEASINLQNKKVFKRGGVNYYNLNLFRKYGSDWENIHEQVTIGRYKKWNINTFGAWSLAQKNPSIPYTLIVSTKKINIGNVEHTIDPFDSNFKIDLKNSLLTHKNKTNDPWLLGVFVHNEIHWGKNLEIPIEILKLKESACRQALESFFENKYISIDKMNQVWSSSFINFGDINSKIDLKNIKVRNDLKDFFKFYVDTYFLTVDREFRKVFPNHLYLGCRFYEKTHGNKIVRESAAKFCDVLSYNIYRYSLEKFDFLDGLNKPILIGEFHFGTGTHGVWGTGLRIAYNLKQQAELYKQFIYEASINSNIIGCHWFQWTDQPATGRFDGENFRIGFVSIVDKPYSNLIDATNYTTSKILEWRK